MSVDVGAIDRRLRAMLGALLVYLAFGSGLALFDISVVKYWSALLGVLMLIVSATRIFPIYAIFGIETCKV